MFIRGGHGPIVDLARDSDLHELIARHDAEGKLIAARCHGPSALVYAKRSNGEPFFKGRRATGFTNTEERLAGLKDVVPFLLEDAMEDLAPISTRGWSRCSATSSRMAIC